VTSLEKPGTNVTGTTMYAPQLIGERLKILQQLVPGLDSVGMILNGNNPNNDAQFRRLQQEAVTLSLRVSALDIRKPEDVAQRFAEASRSGARTLVNGVDSFRRLHTRGLYKRRAIVLPRRAWPLRSVGS